MLRGLFGRKGIEPPTAEPVLDAFQQRLRQTEPEWPHFSSMLADPHGTRPRPAPTRAVTPFEQLDPVLKADILCAVVDGPYLVHKAPFPRTTRVEVHAGMAQHVFYRRDDWVELERSPRVFRAAARVLGEYDYLDAYFHAGNPWFGHLVAIAQAGHVPDEAERGWLQKLKAKLQSRANNKRISRYDHDRLMPVIGWIDRVCGTSDDEEWKLARLDGTQPAGGGFPQLPANFEFWVEFYLAAASRLDQLAGEALARRQPVWMTDEAVFRESFPPFVRQEPGFGFWNKEYMRASKEDPRPFGRLEQSWRKGNRPAGERLVRDCLEAPRTLGLLTINWNADEVPGLARLADLECEADRKLLLHLSGTKPGPRPSPRWIKDVRKLAEPIGWDTVGERLVDWLRQFADVVPTDEALARLHNYWTLTAGCEQLEHLRPELPAVTDRAELDRAAASLAMSAMTGPTGGFLGYLWIWAAAGGTAKLGSVHFKCAERPNPPDYRTLVPSFSNEALLRGVCWLLGEFDGPQVVAVLERAVLASMGMSTHMGARSRSTANAAIAAFARVGTPEALVALGRVRRSVKDKAIANSVAKAIDEVAAKCGVESDDVEETIVPSYGFT